MGMNNTVPKQQDKCTIDDEWLELAASLPGATAIEGELNTCEEINN